MVNPPVNEIMSLVNKRKQRSLDLAQLAMQPAQYEIYRKLFLDEFGDKGLEGELKVLLRKGNAQDMDRSGYGRE